MTRDGFHTLHESLAAHLRRRRRRHAAPQRDHFGTEIPCDGQGPLEEVTPTATVVGVVAQQRGLMLAPWIEHEPCAGLDDEPESQHLRQTADAAGLRWPSLGLPLAA